jgi:hypothetical protein|tara:strand:- start:5519 stop:5878 length:360 start_codon:yes stop_codon:yes gene_type:complete
MAKITINVTDFDIKNGIPEDCARCAIATALRRQITNPMLINVKLDMATAAKKQSTNALDYMPYFEINAKQYYQDAFTKAKEIRKFIFDYDKSKRTQQYKYIPLKPFNFVLDLNKFVERS